MQVAITGHGNPSRSWLWRNRMALRYFFHCSQDRTLIVLKSVLKPIYIVVRPWYNGAERVSWRRDQSPMSALTANLFGPPRIELDGIALDLEHRKPLALLAYLLVTGMPRIRASRWRPSSGPTTPMPVATCATTFPSSDMLWATTTIIGSPSTGTTVAWRDPTTPGSMSPSLGVSWPRAETHGHRRRRPLPILRRDLSQP